MATRTSDLQKERLKKRATARKAHNKTHKICPNCFGCYDCEGCSCGTCRECGVKRPPYLNKRVPHCVGDGIDPGIEPIVRILFDNGIETNESCEGGEWDDGEGHAYREPTVCFGGGREAGFRAYAIAIAHGLRVRRLSRVWTHESPDEELTGPQWEMTFQK